jgi:signal transduction histidine kinase
VHVIRVATRAPGPPDDAPDPESRRLLRQIVRARDEERRRIERDLHDGAQQEVLAVMVGLDLAAGLAADHPELASRLITLREHLDEALERIRSLGRGMFPRLLDQEGIPAALDAMAARWEPPLALTCSAAGRYPAEVESAIFFGCVEAAQNAAKHAGPGAAISLDVAERYGVIAFEVRDDGVGVDLERIRLGQGLVNIAERLEAVGGTLDVASSPGRGTIVTGCVPLGPGTGAPGGPPRIGPMG